MRAQCGGRPVAPRGMLSLKGEGSSGEEDEDIFIRENADA